MKKQKLYFSEDIDGGESAYTKDSLIEEMREIGLSLITVYPAIRETKTDYYFCKAVGEVYEKGDEYDSCGKECDLYDPRNGKSGCCRHRGYCYEPIDQKYFLKSNGKITPFRVKHGEEVI